jgi:hypothetical protein
VPAGDAGGDVAHDQQDLVTVPPGGQDRVGDAGRQAVKGPLAPEAVLASGGVAGGAGRKIPRQVDPLDDKAGAVREQDPLERAARLAVMPGERRPLHRALQEVPAGAGHRASFRVWLSPWKA